jgi:TonB family protein
MKTTSSHIIAAFVICSGLLFLASTLAYSQKDTVEFKFIPKYYPENDTEFIPMPPAEIAHSPKLIFPTDSQLQGKQADVWVKVLVNRKGKVIDAQVFKSSDQAFNKYAIKYAKEFTFKWSKEWPEQFKDTKGVWMSVPARFRP